MKKILNTTLKPFIVFLVFVTFSFIPSKQNCVSDELYESTLKKLSQYALLKDYRIYVPKKKVNDPEATVFFPITLNSGVKYKFWGAQNDKYDGKLTVSLFTTRNGKADFLFATNYRKDIDKFYESIEFQSESTMNCLIAFSFKDGKEGCGLGLSSFLKN